MLFDFLDRFFRSDFFIAGGGASSYEVTTSLRFRSAANAYLNRTFAGASDDPLKFTYSAWVKRGDFADGCLLGGNTGGAAFVALQFASDALMFRIRNSSSVVLCQVSTPAVFRDPSAWYHVVFIFDSANATAAQRTRIFVNGVEQTLTLTTACPLNQAPSGNFDTIKRIGNFRTTADTTNFDGYLAEINLVDGLALDSSYFGQTDTTTGQWVAKKYAGAYGTNGFYLPFTDGTSTTTLGEDSSGNSNDWTLNNISLTAGSSYDWMDDSPSNNFATLNSIVVSDEREGTFADGALKITENANTSAVYAFSSFALPAGKFYVEATAVSGIGASSATLAGVGLATLPDGTTNTAIAQYLSDARKNLEGTVSAFGASYTSADVIGLAVDTTAKTAEFFKNNTSQGVLTWAGTYDPIYVDLSANGGTAGNRVWAINFGQQPFVYAPPSGYQTLCSDNLPSPEIKRGSNYFTANTRTGTGAAFSVTGKRFQPDLVWSKGRSGATDNALYDSVRGVQNQLESNTTTAETSEGSGVTAFNSDGFSGGALSQLNTNAATYVDWLWKESATSGFDIVTYTGSGANRTIAHSLGAVPKFILVKSRDAANDWAVYHAKNTSAPETDYLLLNSTAITADDNTYWNDTAPTSSVFSVGTNADVNTVGDRYVAYLFTEIDGFSRISSYLGNGSADGPFVWCGFRPRWVLIKRTTTSTAGWTVFDTSRGSNEMNAYLSPSSSGAEGSTSGLVLDILSNGFKIRGTQATLNASGATYVFMAFAETPFKFANAR